jgi:hypothetical protein
VNLPADRRRDHLQRRDSDRLGAGDALGQLVEPPLVHQEADGAAVHPEDRARASVFEHFMERLEHEAVAAQRDQCLRLVGWGPVEPLAKHRLSRLGNRRRRRQQADAARLEVALGRVAGRRFGRKGWRVGRQSMLLTRGGPGRA